MEQTSGNGISQQQFFQRFGLNFRIQHMVTAASTLILILTGIPMWCFGKPRYTWWTQDTLRFIGGIETIRIIHRIGAVGLIAVGIYHILWTFLTREGRREFIELLPKLKDVIDVIHNSFYFLGFAKTRPKFARYTYYEKFDYWAVYWGCVIMIGSGLTLWFPQITAKYTPWFTFKLAAIIHADEAILATLAIFIWHFYNVHFNPSRFPGSLLWWHGKISRKEMLHDHLLEYEKLAKSP